MSRSPDAPDPSVVRLQAEHYDVEIKNNFLIVHNVAYVDANRGVMLGKLVKAYAPESVTDHTIHFAGQCPCDATGRELGQLINNRTAVTHFRGLQSQFRLSNTPKPKPPAWPGDYHTLVTHYVPMISGHAQVLDPSISAFPRPPRNLAPGASVHQYPNDALARENVFATAELITDVVGIIGAGGTGSYVLDQVAKTFAPEIHVFDGKQFTAKNAFRAPGAASQEQVSADITKAEHFQRVYSAMHKGIVAHAYMVDASNLDELRKLSFVFVCVDDGSSRKLITDYLLAHNVPFIDVGMGMHVYGDSPALAGTCRVTLGNLEQPDITRKLLPVTAHPDDIYMSNVQIAEMNMINASMAVMEWKRLAGFYPRVKQYEELLFVVEEATLIRGAEGAQ